MGIDDAWKSRVDDNLMKISNTLGRIENFMETSKAERAVLFSKVSNSEHDINEIRTNGCSNYDEHKDTCELVEKHERAYQQAVGVAWFVGIGTPVISGFVSWIVANWTKIKG